MKLLNWNLWKGTIAEYNAMLDSEIERLERLIDEANASEKAAQAN